MTEHAPNEAFYHNDQHIRSAGGTFGDSKAGTRDAGRKGFHRIDNNGDAVLRRGRLYPVNAHGKPFLPAYIRDRFTAHKWGPLHLQHPSLRNATRTFRHAKRYLGAHAVVEWEVKDLHPYTSRARLDEYMDHLVHSAQKVWGEDWQAHVVVKVLTNLRGGKPYAMHVLRAAHWAGFQTMVLPRGEWARKPLNKPFITWNRGGTL